MQINDLHPEAEIIMDHIDDDGIHFLVPVDVTDRNSFNMRVKISWDNIGKFISKISEVSLGDNNG